MNSKPSAMQRLLAAHTRQQLIAAVWDLRDSAYADPHLWHPLSAERLFQCLGDELDSSTIDADNVALIQALARAIGRSLNPS